LACRLIGEAGRINVGGFFECSLLGERNHSGWVYHRPMARPLLAALTQYAPRAGADPFAALRDQVAEIVSTSTGLNLAVLPEVHLYGGSDVAVDGAGTEGFNRRWSQMAPDDPLIDLPIYSARIDPTRWQPKGSL
jgi:hypothetical protein